MKQAFIIGLLFLICTTISTAQNLEEELDKIFQSAYDPTKSGAAILISKNGKTIYQNQIGMANVEHQTPINTTTKFHIGSITKQFTAAAILILEEEGKLEVEDPISKHLPLIPYDKKGVTIAQLLAHTSGIKDYPQIPEIRKQMRDNLSPTNIVDLVNEEDLAFAPGTEVGYSNTSYILLGLIIEMVSGQDYATFLENRIFKTLDMHNTTVANYQTIVANRAVGYSEDQNDQLIHATFHTSPFSAGAIVSNVEDLNKWVQGLHKGKIINEKKLAKMFANNRLENGEATDIGFGWEINQIGEELCYEHSGLVPGYKANSVFIPEQRIYVVVLQNNEYGSPTPTMINAAALVAGKPYPNPTDSTQISEAAAKEITGIYTLENGEERVLFKNENGFHIKALGGQASRLFVLNAHTLFYKEGYRQIHFKKSEEGRIEGFMYENRRLKMKGTKIADAVPEQKNTVQLAIEQMEDLVGIYEFAPFEIAITLEGEALYIQPEGSNKLSLRPISQTTFLVAEIGAEITFTALPNKVVEANLLFEGDQFKGFRKQE